MSWINRIVLVAVILALTLTASPHAQIAFDAAGNGAVVNGTSVSYAHVIGSSANLLVVGILVSSSSDLITAAPTYNGVPMALAGKKSMTTPGLERWVYQYFLTSPATGSHTLTVTAASSADIKVVSASYSGASLSPPDDVITRWDPSGSAMSTTSLTAT